MSLTSSGASFPRIRLVGMTKARLALPGGGSPWVLGRLGGLGLVAQPGAGIAAILANAVTIAVAHGQFDGIRNLRRRPPVVSLAGTCRSR